MPPTSIVRRTLQKLLARSPLVYVDCGARGGRLPRWLRAIKDATYIGFDADLEECERQNASARRGHRYVAAFLAGKNDRRTFYQTRSAPCSSLLRPNAPFLGQFSGLATLFEVEHELNVLTTTLDDLLRAGDGGCDFLELDTQGSELEIPQGATGLVSTSIVGIQVEVEFVPMYINQPLFGDIDAYLRGCGFHLLDLATYRGRRAGVPDSVATRGQLLWGQALYLRNIAGLEEPRRAIKLAMIAAMLDCPDITVAALQQLMASAADRGVRDLAARASALITQDTGSFFPQRLAHWWRLRRVHPRLRASVNQTTWRD